MVTLPICAPSVLQRCWLSCLSTTDMKLDHSLLSRDALGATRYFPVSLFLPIRYHECFQDVTSRGVSRHCHSSEWTELLLVESQWSINTSCSVFRVSMLFITPLTSLEECLSYLCVYVWHREKENERDTSTYGQNANLCIIYTYTYSHFVRTSAKMI